MSTDILFRRLKESDLDQIKAIEDDLFTDAWSFEDFRSILKLEFVDFVVAVMSESGSETIAGYCCGYRAYDESEIVNVAVKRDHQKQGIGEKMLQGLMSLEEDAGVKSFFLEVRLSNRPARYMYKKLGFKEAGIRRKFYDSPVEDAVVMSRRV